MATIKNIRNNKYWKGCGEKETLPYVGKNGATTIENCMEVPKKN